MVERIGLRRSALNRLFLKFLILTLLLFPALSCRKNSEGEGGKKLRVITTLFPLYDFSREIAGDKAEVALLLPPGMEPHGFEPKPEDIIRISKADLFIYTDRYMEPWAGDLLKGIGNERLLVVDSSKGVKFLPASGHDEHPGEDGDEHGHSHEHGEGMDPHIWLDFDNAVKMVNNIAEGMAEKDPANRSYYMERAASYGKKLVALDAKFRKGLSECRSHTFLHGGHYAFGYLAARYGLTYRAAYAISANSEPTPRRIAELVNLMKENNLKYIFYEELISPTMADAIARESGATLLKLHGAHNISKEELNGGATFISLMEKNLENLKKGLECR
jgi:zinc transport system substrate-binding protein